MTSISVIFLALAIAFASAKTIDFTAPITDIDIPTRIVNGSDATVGQFPHQVSLRKANRHFCGATIITNRWLITAAHCTKGRPANGFFAVVGALELNTGGVRYDIEVNIPHPKYESGEFGWDFGLLRTAKIIEFTELIQPAQLPTTNTPAHVPVIISGWGLLGKDEISPPNHLQYLKSKTISSKTCKKRIPSLYEDLEYLLCHRNRYGGACFGDSGEFLQGIFFCSVGALTEVY